MSKKKNYRGMYNQRETAVEKAVLIPLQDEETTGDPIPEISDNEACSVEASVEDACKFVIGEVTGCARLNVREEPDVYAEVICTIPVYSEVQICMSHEFDDWFHVCTAAGQEGYCMKQFITIQ